MLLLIFATLIRFAVGFGGSLGTYVQPSTWRTSASVYFPPGRR
jgi:hypothetical protein